ncbi:MAG: pseudouridine synthase [Verrucomicrobiota bacterium]
MRINRYLASAGLGSRRSCEQLVLDGKVRVNGQLVEDLATTIQSGDVVKVGGKRLELEQRLVLALNKPKGVICSREDLADRPTVFKVLPQSGPRLFYVGRLDKDTEGLLIVTNDGDLAQQLSHPRHKVSKTYEVGIKPKLDRAHIPKLLKGLHIEPGFARADEVFLISDYLVKVVLSQGLKRQIRLMFSKLGYRVNYLKRTQIGGLRLGRLKSGEFKRLSDRDLKQLFQDGARRKPSLRKEK